MWYRTISAIENNEDNNLASSSNAAILARSAIEVETNFDEDTFRPTEVFVATWDKVGYYERKKDKVSPFKLK